MADTADILSQKSLVLIQAYVPTGLGHLRVTYALFRGLPTGVTPVLLGSADQTLTYLHRITSIHEWGRKLQDIIQNGPTESLFIPLFRSFLASNTALLYEQLVTIIDQRMIRPKICVVVSTHFGLGHQLVTLKERLYKKKGIKLLVIVIVTDDSPQRIWYVKGADMTFVPSETTKNTLLSNGKKDGLGVIPIKVVPYPVTPLLTQMLPEDIYGLRKKQVELGSRDKIHMSLPISGAAVWMDYYRQLIDSLHTYSDRFVFHVISKKAPYTKRFLSTMLTYPWVEQYTSLHDREVVDMYETMFMSRLVSLEVTKPSEQAFKALINPTQRGGAILLFSTPVGRQEYDNIHFMVRHHLLPDKKRKEFLWAKAKLSKGLETTAEKRSIMADAKLWRSLELPTDPNDAAEFIWWCLSQGIFKSMMECRVKADPSKRHGNELGDNGVELIWQSVAKLIEERM